jgi:LPXTG-motif cell wall-anchored protein
MTAQDVKNLASKKLFIFLTLFNAAGDEVAFDGASVATDPWFGTTEEWFTIAPAGLAFTGASSTLGLVAGGLSALAAGLMLLLFGRRRRGAHAAA